MAAKDTSDFDAIFGGLVRNKIGYSWLIQGGGYSPWNWPPEWFGDDEILGPIEAQLDEQPHDREGGVIASTGFLDQYMRYLSDDWIDIFAFASRPSAPLSPVSWHVKELPQVIDFPHDASHAFINVDGSYWAMMCDNTDETQMISDRWSNSKLAKARVVNNAT